MKAGTTSSKFRRLTCRGDSFAEITLEIGPSDGTYVFHVEAETIEAFPDSRYIECIEKGIEEAFLDAGVDRSDFRVNLSKATDISGESAPYAFQVCASSAVNEYLGLSHKNPAPGPINDTL